MFYLHCAKLFCYLNTFYFPPCRKSAAFTKLIFFCDVHAGYHTRRVWKSFPHCPPLSLFENCVHKGVLESWTQWKEKYLTSPSVLPWKRAHTYPLTECWVSALAWSQASLSSRSVIQPPWLPFHSLAFFQPWDTFSSPHRSEAVFPRLCP